MQKSNKISVKQLLIVYLIVAASPSIRVLPKYVIGEAKQAAWLTPFISIIPFVLLLFILNTLFTKTKESSIDKVMEKVLTKPIAKILMCIFIIFLTIIVSQYVRFFADRYASTISIFSPIKFFTASILIAAYIITRKEIKYFARFLEVFILPFYLFLAIIFFTGLPNMEIKNFMPITTYDIVPVIKGLVPSLGISGYAALVFFLGDKVSNIGEFKKGFLKLTIIKFIAGILIISVTLGTFGAELSSKFNQPFFMYIKNIKLLDIVERMESLLISSWILTDLAMISVLIFIIKKLITSVFNLNGEKELNTPLILFIYILSNYIATNTFELVDFSILFIPYMNIFICYITPLILFIVGKIRKKV